MDYYQGWFDLKRGVKDADFARDLARYLTYLKDKGLIEGWRLARRKLGLGPPEFAEFHLVMETKNLAQLDEAFNHVALAPRTGGRRAFQRQFQSGKSALRPLPRFSRSCAPGRRREILSYFSPLMRQTSFHSASRTG